MTLIHDRPGMTHQKRAGHAIPGSLPGIILQELTLERPFKLGDWTVYPDRLTLVNDAGEKRIERKAMDTLVFLAAHAGETVSRDAILGEVWKDTFGTDEVLSRVISILRSQLEDSSKDPHYIETIPKVGYRLLMLPEAITQAPDRKPDTIKATARILAVILGLALALYAGLDLWLGSGPAGRVYTIALLPFQDISETEQHRFFAVGLTDELSADLSSSPALRLVARRSLRNEANPEVSDADFYIEGSVRFSGDRVRVFTELTSAEGMLVWSRAYESQGLDYLDIQRELSELIAGALAEELGIAIEPARGPDIGLEAYSHYLNGHFLAKLRGEQPLQASIEEFIKALTIEPDWDEARLGLIHAQVLLPYYSNMDEDAAFTEASTQLARLKANSAEAEAIRGFIAFRQWRWLEAERYFQASLVLDGDNPNTCVWYSQFLSAVGRSRDALVYAQKAYELDSVSPVVNDRLATAYLWMNDDDKALAHYQAGADLGFVTRMNPGYLNLLIRQRNFTAIQEALRTIHDGEELEPLITAIPELDNPAARPGLIGTTVTMIDERRLHPRLELGWWMILEDWPRVTATIRKYQSDKKYIDVEFLFAHESAGYRQTPSFEDIAAELGLAGYWQHEKPDFQSSR